MQGVVFDIKKFAVHDGPGIRTTVFLKGCPLRCTWCHNPESQLPEPENAKGLIQHKKVGWLKRNDGKVGQRVEAWVVMQEIMKDQLFYEESGGGVTFSGGEPLLQVDFITELVKKSKQLGLHTTIDTCGHVIWESFTKVLPYTDLFLYDLKLMDNVAHLEYTGISNRLINENFIKLSQTGKPVRVRIPLIPGVTDTTDNLLDLIHFIQQQSDIREVDLLPFNILSSDKYRKMIKENPFSASKQQSVETLQHIQELFIQNGFRVTVGG